MSETSPGCPARADRPATRKGAADGGLDRQLTGLDQLSHGQLQDEWRRLYRSPPPKRMSRDILALGIAWKLQEQALGGPKSTTRRLLAGHEESLCATGDIAGPRAATLKPGAWLLREWNGETHVVLVLERGFEWRGQRWRSLSAIAREITGARWSGPRFFGLNESSAKRGRAADAKA